MRAPRGAGTHSRLAQARATQRGSPQPPDPGAAGRLRGRPARITGVRATWSLVRRTTPRPRRIGRSVASGALPGRVGRDVEPAGRAVLSVAEVCSGHLL